MGIACAFVDYGPALGYRVVYRQSYGIRLQRGSHCIVGDDDAVSDALRENRIARTALDVFVVEPLPVGNPDTARRVRDTKVSRRARHCLAPKHMRCSDADTDVPRSVRRVMRPASASS